ncbi:hypothetical protein BD626DRAFT_498123 [Schizophyllum amplum]|uniref:Steroid 5-alpha reductase C-terminal domain-containing protein n=1 Tax=Schizophyllum amplum TaxID=97359 RepID=A0A550CCZ2_9AGAR|nr:hypothetical protein BD626DRAFT_498123 [Auriculariopsis ampla]
MHVFSRLLPSLASAYALQTAAALVCVPAQNELFYDLAGSLGFLSTTFVSLYFPFLHARWNGYAVPFPRLSTFAPRQLLLSGALALWSARLGLFLFPRALKAGGDKRFDEVKKQPAKFSLFWLGQATWVFLVGLPVYMVNTLPASFHPPLGVRDYLTFGLFLGSLAFEMLADRQKSQWRAAKNAKQHDEKFISSGLWGISRHPNYVGEVGIQTGIWALATGSLQTAYFPAGAIALGSLSPLVTWFLLRKVSGVPPLEEAGDKKYGSDPAWGKYKKTVPIFWPWAGTD